MKNKNLVLLFLLLMVEGGLLSAAAQSKSSVYKPWSHGQLKVSKENRYLMNADGTPFFWLGDTGWLLPEKLNRDEAAYYLEHCRQAGFNVVQVQTINGVPAMNFYGQYSMIDGFNFKNIDRKGVYGYWDHMDYIIQMGSTGCTTKRMKGHDMILVHSKNTIRQRLPNLSIPVSISISTDYPNNIRSIFISFT